jgi:phosphatidylinositol glycan class V
MLTRLAVPQGLLAVMAFTSYHVQIINRISSGYPLWYWFLVTSAVDTASSSPKLSRTLVIAVYSMVAYAMIQAVLFGSFLPPA